MQNVLDAAPETLISPLSSSVGRDPSAARNFERGSRGQIDSECERPRLWIGIAAGDLDRCLAVCRS